MQSDKKFKVTRSNGFKSYVGKCIENMRKCTWLLRIDFVDCKVTEFESSDSEPEARSVQGSLVESVQQFSSGICIGSEGFILSTEKALWSRRLRSNRFDQVCGRTEGTEFQDLRVLWTDPFSDLIVLVVDDNGSHTKYHYAGVSSNLPLITGSQLLAMGNNNDQPFANLECHTTGPAAKMSELAECFTVRQCAFDLFRTYLPIHGLGDNWYRRRDWTPQAFVSKFGTGIFDKSGLVGVASALCDKSGLVGVASALCFATPITTQVIDRFEKSDELKQHWSK